MPEQKKNLSRRDAIKLLGAAAGATVLANLPAKWSKPSLASGVLPAHAQTSCNAFVIEVLSGQFFAPNMQLGSSGPDLLTGTGGPGSTAVWYCQPGCLFFFFDLNTSVSSTGSVRFTTLAGSVVENYDITVSPFNLRDVAVDLVSGAITIGAGGSRPSAGNCPWLLPTTDEGTEENRRSIPW